MANRDGFDRHVGASLLYFDNPLGLRRSVDLLSRQTRPPERIVVVDNGSRVPAEEVLRDTPLVAGVPIALVRLATNRGVGVGHNTGWRTLLDDSSISHVWVLEHDTFADPDCLEALLSLALEHQGDGDGVVVPGLARNNYERSWVERSIATGARPAIGRVRRFTLNGALVSRAAIEKVGLLREDLFVGQEDWDFARRLDVSGVALIEHVRPLAVHPNKGAGRYPEPIGPVRLYYSRRNSILLAETRSPARLAAGTLRGAASDVLRDRSVRQVAARIWGLRDGLRGLTGQRQYWFLR